MQCVPNSNETTDNLSVGYADDADYTDERELFSPNKIRVRPPNPCRPRIYKQRPKCNPLRYKNSKTYELYVAKVIFFLHLRTTLTSC